MRRMGRQPAKVTKRRKPSRSASRTRAPVGETLPSGAAPALAGTAPIVGIGASAGGVDAVSQLLRHLPSDTGLAFVVIQHLSPSQPSQLSAVLARSTAMSVVQAETGMRPEPDHVYVIPPGVEMVLSGGRLVVGAAEGARATPRSIDLFLASLAKAEQGRAIGVILSGSGSDGVEGLSAIRAEGGIALVEHPASARFPAMPQSAIAAGAADLVLAVDELAREIAELSRAPSLNNPRHPAGEPVEGDGKLLAEILALVRSVCGVDYSEYKSTTFQRRLARRMLLRRRADVADYLALLRDEPAEVEALSRDILIHVTGFFRDPSAFEALSRQVVPTILERHAAGNPIRVWVPGCSTGEEVYSIAICLIEALGSSAEQVPIQIFGTDLSADMIERARAGVYPDAAVSGLAPERLRRFFSRSEAGYCIDKAIRNLCVFVRHDLTRDPPFARLDVISCRNVLIYFSAALQRRVVPLFHYCLNPGGFLLLGHAEAIAGFRGLFASVDKTHKLFAKVGTSHPLSAELALWDRASEGSADSASYPTRYLAADVQRQADGILLGRYVPPCALIDDRLEVVHLRGETTPFLHLGPGQPNLGILSLARPGLRAALRAALERARKNMVTVRREGVEIRDGDQPIRIDLEVIPMAGAAARDRHFLVMFDHAHPLAAGKASARGRERTGRTPRGLLQRLREEADSTRDFLQSLIDERQRLNNEMTAANEELIASNEELQSTNEELESAKEELQSANEELSTVNDELQQRNQELNQVNSDLVNLLASVDIPIIIVGGDRRVRRFTPNAKALMNLIPGDIGRPLDDIKLNVDVADLDDHISEVLASLETKELEVPDRSGHWHRMQIRPYLTVDGKLDGAIIALIDIDVLKQAVGVANAALDQVSAILRTIRVPLVMLDEQLTIRSVNPAYDEAFGCAEENPIGLSWFETCHGAWDSPELRAALTGALTGQGQIALEVGVDYPIGSARTIAVYGSVLRWGEEAPIILITSVDVTERVRLLADAVQARAQAVRANKSKDVFLATLSHELRGPLHNIGLHADLLLSGAGGDVEWTRGAAHAIARSAESLERIIGDLLDVSAIIAGKISLKRRPVELRAVIAAALDVVRDHAARNRIDLRMAADPAVGPVLGDDTRLQQVVVNLVDNAIKFTPAGGEVAVELSQSESRACIRVIDSGQGIAPEFLPHVFDRFAQAHDVNPWVPGGLGLGLAIVRDLVRLHGGTVRAESDGPGTGATFTVEIPLRSSQHRRVGFERDEDTDPSGLHLLSGLIPPAIEADDRDLDGARILLVDDDAGAREVLSEMLRFHGAEVRTVARASDVVSALGEFHPEVLLCDIAIPDEDGYSLIRRIRALPADEGGQVPAIAITALATRTDKRRALAAGFHVHVAKPATIAVLCEAVKRVRGQAVRSESGS